MTDGDGDTPRTVAEGVPACPAPRGVAVDNGRPSRGTPLVGIPPDEADVAYAGGVGGCVGEDSLVGVWLGGVKPVVGTEIAVSAGVGEAADNKGTSEAGGVWVGVPGSPMPGIQLEGGGYFAAWSMRAAKKAMATSIRASSRAGA